MVDNRDTPTGIANTLRRLGARTIDIFWKLGFATRFLMALIVQSGQLVLRPSLLIREMFFAGVLSLIIIVVSGLFVGMVLGLQGYNTLVRFGSADALGTLVALSLLRELGPVLAALLFASRSGSAMTAEIGLMKATEQLDAMAVMGVNPLARIIAPRFWAGVLSLPVLTALFNVMGIFGGYYVGVVMIGLDEGSYWAQMQNAVDLHDDVLNGLIKSAFFGIAVTLIAVFEGYDAEATAAGVSSATTRTVVTSALVILAMDFVLTAFMF
ncbi:MAG: lipid asymmetry maintenance ABC transporter permease subunit MlaE [Pseudomonadales bacterium]|nr:lipid asymmetry maintenance ABC transporter permease subunit MlaE [Pseudomonadales bacterium]